MLHHSKHPPLIANFYKKKTKKQLTSKKQLRLLGYLVTEKQNDVNFWVGVALGGYTDPPELARCALVLGSDPRTQSDHLLIQLPLCPTQLGHLCPALK